jgi:anti-sigma B factor antagonist
VVCTSERIMKLFTITGLDGVFDIHPDLDSAVAAAKA